MPYCIQLTYHPETHTAALDKVLAQAAHARHECITGLDNLPTHAIT